MTPTSSQTLVDQIARTWREVLDVPEVDVDANFFDLGGNSFQLLIVKERLDLATGRTTDLVGFFRYTTVTALATHIYGGGADDE